MNKENVILYDYAYVETNRCIKHKPNKNNVILYQTPYIDLDPDDSEAKDSDDMSVESFESFDSWIEDDILENEINRAKRCKKK